MNTALYLALVFGPGAVAAVGCWIDSIMTRRERLN